MNPFSAQPTPLDLRWRMFGIPVRVHPTFWIFSWLFAYLYIPPNAAKFGWQYILIFVGLMFLAILWHDLGHALLIKLFGYPVQIILFGMGGAPVGQFEQAPRWQRILIHMGGPAAGFLLWGLMDLFKFHLLPRIDPARNNHFLTRGVDFLLFEAFLWSAMNLLPVIPLDFGEVMRELVTGIFPKKKGRILALMLSMVFAGLVAGFSQALWTWAASYWSSFWYLQRLSPFVTMIFFGLYAVMNFFALIGEVTAKHKEEPEAEQELEPAKEEYPEHPERYV